MHMQGPGFENEEFQDGDRKALNQVLSPSEHGFLCEANPGIGLKFMSSENKYFLFFLPMYTIACERTFK